MGEIADSMINGESCQLCGVYIGDEVGYPRYCNSCKPKKQHNKPTTGEAAFKGIKNFLSKKNVAWSEVDLICAEYIRPILGEDTTREQRSNKIQEDFGAFIKWFNKYQKERN